MSDQHKKQSEQKDQAAKGAQQTREHQNRPATESEIAQRNAKLSTESLERAARADGHEPEPAPREQQRARSVVEQQGDDEPGVNEDGVQLQHRDGSVGYLDGYRAEGSAAGPPDPPLMGNRTYGTAQDALRAQVEQYAPRVGEFKLVRIKPTNKREQHSAAGVTIRKADGWVKVRTEVAEHLRKERMNEMNPQQSPEVFDVVDTDDAQAIHEKESLRVSPAGTPQSPREALHDERPMGTGPRRRV